MKKRSLGVLITSEKNGVHLRPIFRASERKGIALFIHLQGDGVRLCLKKKFQDVLNRTRFSVCCRSARMLGIAEAIRVHYAHALTSDAQAPLTIRRCTRQIVL